MADTADIEFLHSRTSCTPMELQMFQVTGVSKVSPRLPFATGEPERYYGVRQGGEEAVFLCPWGCTASLDRDLEASTHQLAADEIGDRARCHEYQRVFFSLRRVREHAWVQLELRPT